VRLKQDESLLNQKKRKQSKQPLQNSQLKNNNFASSSFKHRLLAGGLPVLLSVQSLFAFLPSAYGLAAGPTDPADEPSPSGTMLLPMTPKLDLTPPEEVSGSASVNVDAPPVKSTTDSEDTIPSVDSISAEKGSFKQSDTEEDADTVAEDGKLLKGTVQIVADDTEYDQDKNTFLGTGNAVAIIGGQDSRLEADTIFYDQDNDLIDARGNVRILRGGTLTTGSAFKFKVSSDQYMITKPDTEIQGATVIARRAYGSEKGLVFRNGTIQSPTPFYYYKNYNVGPLQARQDVNDKKQHPDAFLPANPSFRFKANKIVYEKYKEDGNLTVYGGRFQVGSFSIPTGKFVMTVGQTETRAVFPVLPYLGSNMNMGGFFVGPSFNTGIGKTGVLSWGPLVQFGGQTLASGGGSTSNSVGLGARAGFSNKIFQTHIAYGQVSNLLVADFKAKIYKNIRYQGGINRFLNDGMFGSVRARYASEFNAVRMYTKVPGMAMVQLRTTAGWYEDNPQLVNISSGYAALYGSNATRTQITSGYKVQQQIMGTTQPFFALGDDKYGLKGMFTAAAAARGYSAGNTNFVGQVGPILDLRLNKVRLFAGYTEASVRGSSPFVFDQYIQGSQSTYVMGDYKVSKYLDLGGLYGYNLTSKLAYSKQLQMAVGPQDVKLLLSRDFLLNSYRVGFDMLHGAPVNYNKMVVKQGPDQGQLGGI
jgi:lipopolysaccharide export system protein LptA